MIDVHSTTLGDLKRIAQEQGPNGRVATGQGLLHHSRSAVAGRSGTGDRDWRAMRSPSEAQMQAALREDLPPVIRREARERYKALVKRLYEDGLRTYKTFGYPVWPKSIQNELRTFGWKEGNPDLWGQVETLARKYVEEGAQRQREKDQRKTTLDWSGHTTA